MMMALSPDDRRRLAGVLARLASDHAGEREAAALLATRLVKDRDVTWLDVLQPDPLSHKPGAADPRHNADPGSDLALCQRHIGRLNAWEHEFVWSVARARRRTPGQSRKLAEIADALRRSGAK
jgi:hypothetical protein